jgi:hypothetical protein
MATIIRYQAFVPTKSGDAFRIDIIDLDHTDGGSSTWGWNMNTGDDPRPFSIVDESLVIEYDGDDDTIHQPIIGSTCRFDIFAESTDDTGVISALMAGNEYKVAVEIRRYKASTLGYTEVYWRGVALPEAVRYEYSHFPYTISMNFTDGLSTLRDIPYVDTDLSLFGDSNTGTHESARTQIGRCLKHLPHIDLWADSNFLFGECTDLFHAAHATFDGAGELTSRGPVMNNTGCNQDVWYEERSVTPPYFRKTETRTTGMQAYEVIENWMVTLGLRFSASYGIFWAVSPFLKITNRGQRTYGSTKRMMVDDTYKDDAPISMGTSYIPDSIDVSDQKILKGGSKTFLPAVYGVYYKHLESGAARLFPTVPWVGIEGEFPSTSLDYSQIGQVYDVSQQYTVQFPLSNSTAHVPTGQKLRMTGTLQHWFDNEYLDSTNEELARGCQFSVQMKIKVGPYYLHQTVGFEPAANFTNNPDFGKITGLGSNITTWLPLIITSDVEWTTDSASRFSFPAFIPDETRPVFDTIQYTDTEGQTRKYHVGWGCKRDYNNTGQMKYTINSRNTWNVVYETDMDFALPELPTTNGYEESVEISVQINMHRYDGSTLFGIGAANTAIIYPVGSLRSGARMFNFNLYTGDGVEDDDTFYFAKPTNPDGHERILGGQSALGSRVLPEYGEIGAITADGSYSHSWHSEHGFVNESEGTRNFPVLAEEHMRFRKNTREVFDIELLIREREVVPMGIFQRYKILDMGVVTILDILRMSYNLVEGTIQLLGVKGGRSIDDITGIDSTSKKEQGGSVPPGGGGIVSTEPIWETKGPTVGGGGITETDKDELELLQLFMEK